MSKKLTKRAEDYSKWYNEIIQKADLAENSAVRGCMVIKPYGFAIWEKMQAELDRMFKESGHENHYRLQNDPDNTGKLRVDPEAKLEEELIVRPTSEAGILHMQRKLKQYQKQFKCKKSMLNLLRASWQCQ